MRYKVNICKVYILHSINECRAKKGVVARCTLFFFYISNNENTPHVFETRRLFIVNNVQCEQHHWNCSWTFNFNNSNMSESMNCDCSHFHIYYQQKQKNASNLLVMKIVESSVVQYQLTNTFIRLIDCNINWLWFLLSKFFFFLSVCSDISYFRNGIGISIVSINSLLLEEIFDF